MHVFKLRSAYSLGGLLAGLSAVVTMLAVTSTDAMAMHVPPPGGGDAVIQQAPPLPVAVGGMPGWEITLIAVGAALVAAVLAVLADRARRPAAAAAGVR
jgi:hypothetical protein